MSSNSLARVFEAFNEWLLPPMGALHSGQRAVSMAPPHCVAAISKQRKNIHTLTYLRDHESMPVLAIIEVTTMCWTSMQ